MAAAYKIHKGPDGRVKGFGPNIDEYQPCVVDGDILEYSDSIPEPDTKDIADAKLVEIDADTSANIEAGFEYTVDGVSYHFSYDSFDQQNFADSANVASLIKSGVTGLPQSTAWNAYKNWTNGSGELVQLTFTPDSFIALYTAGALAHKSACMIAGATRKQALKAAIASNATVADIKAI